MKRILYTLIGIMLSTGAWAETLQEKIDNATGATTIQLTDDVDLGAYSLVIPADKNITLDLNGHSITSSANAVAVKNNGTLTVKDTSGEQAGKIISTKYAGIGAGDNSTTTFESGNIESVEGAIITGKVVNATISINGGTFSATDNAVIMGNGSARDGNANTITINGGTFNGQIKSAGYVACGIYAPWKDVITVNGGTFNITGGCGILARAGSVTINDGVFNCSGTATGKVGDSRVVVPCSAVVYDSEARYPAMTAESKIEVPSTSTATFKSQDGVAAVSVVGVSHIEISGGTYSSPLTEDVCAEGYIPSNTPNADGTYGAKAGKYVAQIGTTKYETLAAAFAAITDNTATTIEVLSDCSGNGIIVPSGRDITVNFNNHTYTVNTDVLAGSNGTKNQCFQLLRDSKVTFNNGTIVADNAAIKMIIQNYSDLTLTGMTIDATQGTNSVGYVVSNNNGNTVFGTGTTITAKDTGVAFDVYSFKNQFNYTGAKVTVDGATINGKIEVSAKSDGCDVSNLGLVLTSGTINGTITMGNRADEATVTKSGSMTVTAPDGYKWDSDGKLVQKNYVAQIGETKYETLAEAFAAVQNSETVTLISDINESVENTNANSFTIDLNGKTWTSDATSTFKNNGGTVTITDESGNGTIKNTANAKDMGIAVWARTGSVVIENGTFINQSNYEATLYVGTTAANLGSKQPTMTVKGGTFKNEATGKYAHKDSLLPLTLNVINNITSYQAISISGGTFYGNDPALGDDNLGTGVAGGNFLADGYVAEKKADGTYGVREGVFVAKIGDKKYESLSDAVAAATAGQTITLLADVTVDKTILIEKNITIDGDGKTIKSTVTSILGTFYVNEPTCTFAIENATIDGQNTASMAVCVYRGKANDTLDATPTVDTNNSGNNVTLTNCTVQNFTGWPGSYVGAVYAYSKSHLTLNNCTFTGNTTTLSTNGASGADVWTGAATTVVINGGTYNEVFVNTNSSNTETVTIKGGAEIEELAICVSYKEDGSTNIPVLTIDNATVTNLTTEERNPIPETGITIQNEGSITNKPAFEAAKILNGTKTNAFASLDDAIDAAKAEQTITLLKDAIATKELPANVTIDAASHALTLPTFKVSDGTALTYAKVTNATDDTYKVTTATYNRTGAAGTKWGTVCLPFSFESAPDGYTLYTPTAVNATTLTVTEVSYPVAAGTPVIFYKDNTNEVTMTSNNASVKIDAAPVAQSGTLALVGTFSNQKIESNLSYIYFINGDKFHQAQVSLTVPAYRAYINYTTGTAAKPSILNIFVGGEATGVEKVSMENESVEGIYDVNGMKLSAPKKGMNIMKLANGKTVKLIVK